MSLRATLRALGSCGKVSACHPTIEYMSWSSGAASRCSFTQFNRAPSKLPSYARVQRRQNGASMRHTWGIPVGCMPEKTTRGRARASCS